LFVNLRLSIFVYYVTTVATFLTLFYFLEHTLLAQNLSLLFVFLASFVVLSGVFISKLSVEPLLEHIENLQALSKETLHELNLPISIITSNIAMIKKGSSDEKTLRRIARVESACEMLEKRYNELDYMIKMQSQQEIEEQIALKELVEKRVAFLQQLYPDMAFHLKLKEVQVLSDKIGLEKVIDNLIDNAVKYSQKSKVIEIVLEDDKLSIEDFGCGIDDVELVKIFDRYYQTNKSVEGFGIGLSMVKRFCDKNRVELTIKSQLQKGTKVQMRFK